MDEKKKILNSSEKDEIDVLTDIWRLFRGSSSSFPSSEIENFRRFAESHQTLGIEESPIKEMGDAFRKVSENLSQILELVQETTETVTEAKKSVLKDFSYSEIAPVEIVGFDWEEEL